MGAGQWAGSSIMISPAGKVGATETRNKASDSIFFIPNCIRRRAGRNAPTPLFVARVMVAKIRNQRRMSALVDKLQDKVGDKDPACHYGCPTADPSIMQAT